MPRERKSTGHGSDSSDNEDEHSTIVNALLAQTNTQKSLMSLNSDTNLEEEVIDLTIHQAAREGALRTIKEEFEDRGIDAKKNINQQNREQQTPLHLAAIYNHEEVIRFLFQEGAWLDALGEHENTPLNLAIKNDATIAAKTLIQLGATITAKNTYGTTPLHFAANRGNKEICRLLVSYKEIDVNVADYGMITPLHMSVYSGKTGIAQLLLSHGARSTVKDIEDKLPIHVAAGEGKPEFVKILLKAMQAEILQSQSKTLKPFKVETPNIMEPLEVKTNEGKTPLHLASQFGHTHTVKTLIDLGANLHCRCNNNSSVLHSAAIGGHVHLIKLLIKNKCRINARDDYQMTPLHRACLYGHLDAIKLLSALGANLEVRNSDYYTPLLCAVWNGQVETAKHLISVGANVKATDITQSTALHIAIRKKCIEILKVLLENEDGAMLINVPEKRHWTPLHFAAAYGTVKFIEMIIKHGGLVNLTDNRRKTPLHLSAESGKVKTVSMLCKLSPSSINKTDDAARTPLVCAAICGHLQVCEKLISVGGDVLMSDDVLMSSLHYAASKGYPKIVKLLLENHAKLDATDLNFETPLHHASSHGNVECIRILLERGARIDMKDKSGKLCFDLAIENYQKHACLELLKHKRWRVLMRNMDHAGKRPMEKMIELEPDVAEKVLDNCIAYSKESKEHRDYSIKYNFEYVNVQPAEEKGFFGPSYMAKYNRESLLSHPVTINLINDKWKLLGRQLYFMLLLLYCGFVVLLTYLVVEERNWLDKHMNKSNTINAKGNSTFVYNHPRVDDVDWECDIRVTHIMPIILFSYIVIQLVKELYQMVKHGPYYFMEMENYIELCLYISALIFDMCFFMEHYKLCENHVPDMKYTNMKLDFGSIAILFAYCNLLLHLKRFPFCGLVIVMFIEVLRTVIGVLIVFSVVIVGFGLSFHYLIGGYGSAADPAFDNVSDSIIQVISMTIGDGTMSSAQKARGGKTTNKENMNVVLYLVFTLLLPIVMMNLMVGLAVGEIAEVTKSAKLRMLKAQVDLVTRFERRYPKRFVNRFYRQNVTLYPNQRNFWETFMDWLGTYTFDSLASNGKDANYGSYQENKSHQMSSADLEVNFLRHKKRIQKLHSICEEQRDMIQQVLGYVTKQELEDGTQDIFIPSLIINDPNGESVK